MRFVKELIVIVIISFFISLLVYLSLIPNHKKPTTYKELTLEHFLNNW